MFGFAAFAQTTFAGLSGGPFSATVSETATGSDAVISDVSLQASVSETAVGAESISTNVSLYSTLDITTVIVDVLVIYKQGEEWNPVTPGTNVWTDASAGATTWTQTSGDQTT